MRSLCFIISLFFLAAQANVIVLPSNNSQNIAVPDSPYFRLWGGDFFSGQHLAPLTPGLLNLTHAQGQDFYISGNITEVTNANALGVLSSQISCISCDPAAYAGNLGVDWTLESVVQAPSKPAAIILYSSSATHCTLSVDAAIEPYSPIFTVTDHETAVALEQTFSSPNRSAHISMSSFGTNNMPGGGSPGSAPNTAMFILYSITGIITALFLGIIITGAVRAHRHPERYGPRQIAGRPRQSRARGIARAMLDTIPIVKFDHDAVNNDVDAAKRDVEMANSETPRDPASGSEENVAAAGHTTPRETEIPIAEEQSERPGAISESNPQHAPDAGNFSCPICTDDFVKGQDLRVLPCNHQFHPECVDPWLVNVSGTCPLCRIDLNPPKEENAEGESADGVPDGTEPAADASQNRHSRRLTNYLNARRMHNASVEERIAALRRIREANQDDPVGERVGRSRLTRRLRERFRIRTRAHGVDTTPVESAGPSTPTVTVPASAYIMPTTNNIT